MTYFIVDRQHSDEASVCTSNAQEFAPGNISVVLKRAFDIGFSAAAVIVFSILMIVIAGWIKLSTGGPVLFSQTRVGNGGKKFNCLKFRTMHVDAETKLQRILKEDPKAAAEFAATFKLRNDPRIIPGIGTFLRKTSLDELPQFFNVLIGEMSIVGPRPVTEEEYQCFYGADHSYILVRPGITGVWQTSGRNDVSFAERVRMDEDYVKNWSFFGDLAIILRTVAIVCRDQNGH